MRPVTPSDGNRKVRKSGRHSLSPRAKKKVPLAAKAIPAVALIGALAAVPLARELTATASTAKVRTLTAAAQPAGADTAGGHVVDLAAVNMLYTHRLITAMAEQAAAASSKPRRPQHAKPARVVHRAAPAPAKTPASAASSGANSGQRSSGQQNSHQSGSQQGPGSSDSPGGGTLTCSGSASGPLPENYATIVSFLVAHGYTGIAAAGIAGNIYQESGGNPESVGSGGGGLIGWTPLPGGYVTGNPAADLQTQLQAVLVFNQQWAQYIPALNSASSAAAAADVYVTDFERAGIPAAGNREAAAEAVASACGL